MPFAIQTVAVLSVLEISLSSISSCVYLDLWTVPVMSDLEMTLSLFYCLYLGLWTVAVLSVLELILSSLGISGL